MLYMIVEHFRDGDPLPVYRRFQEQGRMAPDGLRYVASWVTDDLRRCFQIMECDDPTLLTQWTARWEDVIEFEIVPVITSAEAVAAVAPRLTRGSAGSGESRVTMADAKPNFWHSGEQCWACRVLTGGSPASIVVDDDQVLAVINPLPLNPGHTLVLPRQHIKNVYEMPDELAGPILSTATRVARAMKRALRADGVTLRQNNDRASDQHLFHFHLHVIPRFVGDGDRFNSEPKLTSQDEQDGLAARLRAALDP